jgi:hypothetical protein
VGDRPRALMTAGLAGMVVLGMGSGMAILARSRIAMPPWKAEAIARG